MKGVLREIEQLPLSYLYQRFGSHLLPLRIEMEYVSPWLVEFVADQLKDQDL